MYGDSDYTYRDERFLMTGLSNCSGVHPKLIQYCMSTILQLRKRIIWPDLPKILSFNRKKYLLLYSSAKSIGKYPLSGTSPTLSFIQFLKFLTWYIYKKNPQHPTVWSYIYLSISKRKYLLHFLHFQCFLSLWLVCSSHSFLIHLSKCLNII